ncbi:hypothetical protein AHMF7605_13305 [Adhaeribacter arboris]|uniref:Uncharacterized protein n=1 Tax=Adhaeribacter arboris TaxID=2072846 RepID=A0A2T2YP50_9BACT|nr:hypothetical protein [Adhaeribacter arboris]PSR57297.1 hypothetical protein AHMF7605_13305 [Adhaeribacter arboris]
MKKLFAFLLVTAPGFSCFAQTTVPTPEIQIKAAVMAAPADKREGAAVYGYTGDGNLVLLRKGTNELICLADDPKQKGFSASCYHKDLEPFMARGRALRKEGKSGQEIFDAREQEAKSGKLKMPKNPTTLFSISANDEDFDKTTGEVKNGYIRSVVYIPFATAESTGLPLKPDGPGLPWIMDPGKHNAHIMINPPRPATATK